MVAISHLVSPASLPAQAHCLSVMSWNVLLPNSADAWWTYKMYSPPMSEQHIASWEYRKELLRARISLIDADVVCLQEVAPASFEDDFSFMQDLGYDGREMFRRGRFRPATFWKTSRCELASSPVHKDRTLLTAFRLSDDDNNTSETHHWHVLNCHLQAGKEGRRRVRQINDGVRAAMTLARRLEEPDPESSLRLVVCGDFNGGPECGAVRYLEDGFVDDNFLEDGEPVTSKKKQMPLSTPLTDVACSLEREPPPTLVVPELISLMVKEGTIDEPKLSSDIVERLTRIFDRCASQTDMETTEKYMDVNDVEKWLVTINRMIGRGSEFREAARQMGWEQPEPDMTHDQIKDLIVLPKDGKLTLEGFLIVYEKELRGGKFWGIAHDLAVLGEPLPHVGMFRGRYDRMYCSAALRPTVVLDTVCDKACPNDSEPSDHLPVAAVFTLKNSS